MFRFPTLRFALVFALAVLAAICLPLPSSAQDDPSEAPLGDVARHLRKKTPPSKPVIDNDNFSAVMDQVDNQHAPGSGFKLLMAGDDKGFQVSAIDATCNLSFSANARALLTSQYAQMDLPPSEVSKLEGPATIEGDALTVSVRNRTDWHVSEVAIALTVVKKSDLSSGLSDPGAAGAQAFPTQPYEFSPDEVRPEKKPDLTVIYRMRAAAPPSTTTVFSTPLNVILAPGDDWHWAIVQARGYPPEGRMEQARIAQAERTPQKDEPAVVPPSAQSAPQDAPLSPSPVSLPQ